MAVGSACTSSLSSVRTRLALCTSTIGVSPVTVIVSASVADLQVGVDRGDEFGRQLDAFALDGAEPGQRERDRVGAGPQVDDPVLPGAVGDGGSDLFDQRRRSPLRRSRPACTAPDASLTTPAIDEDCANAAAGRSPSAVSTSATVTDLRITPPSFSRVPVARDEPGRGFTILSKFARLYTKAVHLRSDLFMRTIRDPGVEST